MAAALAAAMTAFASPEGSLRRRRHRKTPLEHWIQKRHKEHRLTQLLSDGAKHHPLYLHLHQRQAALTARRSRLRLPFRLRNQTMRPQRQLELVAKHEAGSSLESMRHCAKHWLHGMLQRAIRTKPVRHSAGCFTHLWTLATEAKHRNDGATKWSSQGQRTRPTISGPLHLEPETVKAKKKAWTKPTTATAAAAKNTATHKSARMLSNLGGSPMETVSNVFSTLNLEGANEPALTKPAMNKTRTPMSRYSRITIEENTNLGSETRRSAHGAREQQQETRHFIKQAVKPQLRGARLAGRPSSTLFVDPVVSNEHSDGHEAHLNAYYTGSRRNSWESVVITRLP